MASRNSGIIKAVDSPMIGDDFKVIAAIGPGIERRLHNAGIQTFAQLAAKSPADIAALVTDLAGMSSERIAQLDWIGRARELASEPAETNPPSEGAFSGGHQHYATFTVELLLDEKNNVRRTRVAHVQDKDEETWAGWKEDSVVNFITEHAGLPLIVTEPIPPSTVTMESAVAIEVAADSTSAPGIPVVRPGGTLRLHDLKIVPTGVIGSPHNLRYDQLFSGQLTLDFSEVTASSDDLLHYTAAIYAKSMAGGPRQIVSEAKDTITLQDRLTITMPGTPLSPGTYRLEAVVTLIFPSGEPGLLAHLEGSLLLVY